MAETYKPTYPATSTVNTGQGPITGFQKTLSDTAGQSPDLQAETLVRSLSSSPSPSEMTIMDRFNLAQQEQKKATDATRALLLGQGKEAISAEQEAQQGKMAAELESRRGFATNTALMRDLEKTGATRIKTLTDSMNQALLQNDALGAKALSDLLVEEQSTITTARKEYVANILDTFKTTRTLAQEKELKELELSQKQKPTEPFEIGSDVYGNKIYGTFDKDGNVVPISLGKELTGTDVVDADVLNGMLSAYRATGQVPAFGMSGKSQLRQQFYEALGRDSGIPAEAAANKAIRAGIQTALTTQTNQYSANLTAIGTLEKQLELAKKYSDTVSRAGSPFVNKYLLWIKGQGVGDADTAAFNNIVKTASYEFAKILSGAAASIAGVTVSSAADAEALLNSALSKGQFNEVLDVMNKEAQFRLTSQKDTIDKLRGELTAMREASKTGGALGQVSDTEDTTNINFEFPENKGSTDPLGLFE